MNERYETGGDINRDERIGFRSSLRSDYYGESDTETGFDLCEGTDDSYENDVDDFEDSNIGKDLNEAQNEHLDSILVSFLGDNWNDISLQEQKKSITDLANYAISDMGIKNPPEIVFRNDMPDGSYGGYLSGSNVIEINVNMLDDAEEAADTITHEMWHAYQQECANDPTSEKGRAYRDGFDNYISPEYDFEGYENQMVEAEARDYAQGYKDKLARL